MHYILQLKRFFFLNDQTHSTHVVFLSFTHFATISTWNWFYIQLQQSKVNLIEIKPCHFTTGADSGPFHAIARPSQFQIRPIVKVFVKLSTRDTALPSFDSSCKKSNRARLNAVIALSLFAIEAGFYIRKKKYEHQIESTAFRDC